MKSASLELSVQSDDHHVFQGQMHLAQGAVTEPRPLQLFQQLEPHCQTLATQPTQDKGTTSGEGRNPLLQWKLLH